MGQIRRPAFTGKKALVGQIEGMSDDRYTKTAEAAKAPEAAAMRAANVNPDTGLATDYLNVFNEYIMLAELVADGSMDAGILADWQPVDYESHFVETHFRGYETVLAAYRAIDHDARAAFEEAVNGLIDLILAHQEHARIGSASIEGIKEQRDLVAALITGPAAGADIDSGHRQAEIDALFD